MLERDTHRKADISRRHDKSHEEDGCDPHGKGSASRLAAVGRDEGNRNSLQHAPSPCEEGIV